MKTKLLLASLMLSMSFSLFAQNGTNIKWSFNEETCVLSIVGTGAMTDYESVAQTGSGSPYRSPFSWYADRISSIIISDGITKIGDYSFETCGKVTSISIPNSVTTIGKGAFQKCISLTSIEIPNSVTSIRESAFQDCSALTSVHIFDMAAWCKIYFTNSGANPLCKAHNLYLNGTLVTDMIIPNSVTYISKYAFENCSSLTSIEIPNSVTNIRDSAFCDCTYLEEIVIGNGVTTDGIGKGAFAKCPYLLSVTCKALFPPVINSNVFTGCGVLSGIDLYVPEESIKQYKKATVWSQFNINGKDFPNDNDPTNPENSKYKIMWQDEDGNILKTDEVAQGTTPAFTGTTPTKTATNEYTYEFAGWLPTIKAATEDVRYTTFFERNKIEPTVYTVNINGENCSLNINNQYSEGTVITIEAVADECFEFQQWSDGNKDNPRTVTVTKDMNLTAEFNKLRYTITGEVDSSKGGKVQIIKK